MTEQTKRYEHESYMFRGDVLYRVIDTFNGDKTMAKGLTRETDAITRRDELNQFQAAGEIEFTTRQFEAAHGRRPSGRGSWAFCDEQHANSNDYLEHTFWFTGLYSDAKRAARKHFAAQQNVNVSVVVVMS